MKWWLLFALASVGSGLVFLGAVNGFGAAEDWPAWMDITGRNGGFVMFGVGLAVEIVAGLSLRRESLRVTANRAPD